MHSSVNVDIVGMCVENCEQMSHVGLLACQWVCPVCNVYVDGCVWVWVDA